MDTNTATESKPNSKSGLQSGFGEGRSGAGESSSETTQSAGMEGKTGTSSGSSYESGSFSAESGPGNSLGLGGSKGSNEENGASGTSGTAARSMSSNAGAKPKQDINENSLLKKYFEEELKDIYYAEKLLLQSLPRLQEAASTEELKEAFEDHLHQTRRHVSRLEKVFEILGKKAEGKKCEAMTGITKEAETVIKDTEDNTMTRDVALIIAAQKVEHYEIATYGGLVSLAITMGKNDIAEILDRTLVEEEAADRLLTDIAESYINIQASFEEEGDEVPSRQKQEA